MLTVRESLTKLKSQCAIWSNTPALDAQVLLSHICNKGRSWILAHPEIQLTSEQQSALNAVISRVETGEPLPYILGHWSFYGLDFKVNADTLIPRPETELMVENALQWLNAHPGRRSAIDIGTGSGCIAISLAVHIPDLNITGLDISLAALEVASINADKHDVTARLKFVHADLLPDNLLRSYDLICANLPYIPTKTLKGLDVFGREPTLALDGGPDGLRLIRRLLPQAAQILAPDGLLLLEIETTQGEIVLSLVGEFFPRAKVELLPDLAGHDRLIRIETFAKQSAKTFSSETL
ncbi:MAG: peptide chain release factor N(5)-glutamine methyltransferase [Anaerolineales bacterium]